jgi:hypothetical protein
MIIGRNAIPGKLAIIINVRMRRASVNPLSNEIPPIFEKKKVSVTS